MLTTCWISRFERVETARGPAWFPLAWSTGSSAPGMEYTVDEFTLNEPIDPATFRPHPPAGVPIVDNAQRDEWLRNRGLR